MENTKNNKGDMTENDSSLNEKKEHFPEQLDDNEFEKEKEELRKLKEQKKLEKRMQSKNKKIEYDEDGNIILKSKKNKKKMIITILVIVLIFVVIIGGIAAYFIINLNKPENIIYDNLAYFNSQNWDEFIKDIDFKGYYVLSSYLEEAEYTKFDDAYNEVENEDYYEQFQKFVDVLLVNKEDIFSVFFEGVTLNIEDIISVEKIENTDSLYKIKVDLTISDSTQSSTKAVDLYVAKIDKEYKIVGGEIPYLVYYSLYTYYYYPSTATSQDTIETNN